MSWSHPPRALPFKMCTIKSPALAVTAVAFSQVSCVVFYRIYRNLAVIFLVHTKGATKALVALRNPATEAYPKRSFSNGSGMDAIAVNSSAQDDANIYC